MARVNFFASLREAREAAVLLDEQAEMETVKLQCGIPGTLIVALVGPFLGTGALAATVEGRVRTTLASVDLSDFVISVEDLEGPWPVPTETAVLDQKELRFVPHVLAIQVGTTVEFPNTDPVSHNVFSISDTKRFNLGLYRRGAIRRLRFDRPGIVELLCNVHLEMSAYIVVLKIPYFAQPKSDGTYRIENVPAGQHRLRCWHERLPAQERTVLVPETGSVTADFLMTIKR